MKYVTKVCFIFVKSGVHKKLHMCCGEDTTKIQIHGSCSHPNSAVHARLSAIILAPLLRTPKGLHAHSFLRYF
jgi:hypothetical protein